MVFKVGGTTVIDNSGNHISGTANGTAATPTGFKNSGSNDIGELIRFTTYTDDLATNCRGYLPAGNCNGNTKWTTSNGSWWTWGATGVPTTNAAANSTNNPSNYDGAGGWTFVKNPVSVNYVYDAYAELYNRVRGSDQHRNYSHCNCNSGANTVGACYTNCNCDCACVCACACDCQCNC